MARQNIGDLRVSIGADTKDLARGIGRAKAMMGGLARVAKTAGIAAGAAFTAASAGMVMMSREGLKFVDAQAKMARSVDGSIDGLRALQLAGSDAGASVDIVNKALQMMGKRLAEADQSGTGTAVDALEMLGLNARELIEMDVDQRITEIADRVNALGLSAQDAAQVMRDFGVRNNEVALLLLQGSDAIRKARQEVELFGVSMDQDAAAGVERANDAMSRISLVFEGMRNQLAVGIAPALERAAQGFQGMMSAGGPLQQAVETLVGSFTDLVQVILDPAFIESAALFGSTIAGAVTKLAGFVVTLANNAEIAGVAMVGLGTAMAFFSGPIGLAIAAVSGGIFLLSTRLGDTETAADDAAEAEGRLTAALDILDTSNADAVASGQRLIESHITQARAAVEAAKAEIALARAKEKAGNALLDQNPLTANGNSGYAEAMAENTAAAEAELDRAEAQLERYARVLEGFTMSRFPTRGTVDTPTDPGGGDEPTHLGEIQLPPEKLAAALDTLIAKIDPAKAKLEQLAEAKAILKQALDQGVISQEQYNARLAQAEQLYAELPEKTGAAAAGVDKVTDSVKQSAEAGSTMADEIDGAIGRLIDNIESGTDALQAFAVELVKIFAIQGVSSILGSSDWMGSVWKPGQNALGTDNWRGGWSWVGERGPELVNLPRGAQVIPNHKLGGMGGGGGGFTYAPNIDARGASLEAVQELKQTMERDARSFDAKVRRAVGEGKMGRMLR